MTDRYLVTGAAGCIGAWTVEVLARRGDAVVATDIAPPGERFDMVVPSELRETVEIVPGIDVSDFAAVDGILDERDITKVIHLAALQIPACRADPPRGALVNVVGTANVFEAVRRRSDRIRGLVYTSSIGVYGPPDSAGSTYEPATHYGVYKHANESTARVYWHESGVASVGLRPYVVYGVGRDQGMTSAPTMAMLAAALGLDYHIPFGGSSQLHYVEDVARSIVMACDCGPEAAHVFDLGGPATSMDDVVATIAAIAPEASSGITYADVPLPFPPAVSSSGLERTLGAVPRTELVAGVRATVDRFRRLAASGGIPERLVAAL